jgi:hypothetical protein
VIVAGAGGLAMPSAIGPLPVVYFGSMRCYPVWGIEDLLRERAMEAGGVLELASKVLDTVPRGAIIGFTPPVRFGGRDARPVFGLAFALKGPATSSVACG